MGQSRNKKSKFLNDGAHATVYRNPDNKTVTKIIKSDAGDGISLAAIKETDMYCRFAEEVPNYLYNISVKVTKHKNYATTCSIIMPRLHGDLISGQKIKDPEERVKVFPQLFNQMTMALGQLHASKLLHRDIKPYNILIDEKITQSYLVDFFCFM